MERRVTGVAVRRTDSAVAVDDRSCLRCGQEVPDRARGCKGAHCRNCGHPYPLGDCSD